MTLVDREPEFVIVISFDPRHCFRGELSAATNVNRLKELLRERLVKWLIIIREATRARELYVTVCMRRNEDLTTQAGEASLGFDVASDQTIIQRKDRKMNLDIPHSSDRLHQQRSNVEPGVIKQVDNATIFWSHSVSSPMIRAAGTARTRATVGMHEDAGVLPGVTVTVYRTTLRRFNRLLAQVPRLIAMSGHMTLVVLGGIPTAVSKGRMEWDILPGRSPTNDGPYVRWQWRGQAHFMPGSPFTVILVARTSEVEG